MDGTPVRTIRAGGLAAAVSSVDRAQFSAVSLRRTPEDLRRLEDIAQAHHDVVDALARAVALAPMPLGTLRLNDDSVTESAAARLRRLVNEEWQAPSPRLELTGPQAAYSFATVDEPWP